MADVEVGDLVVVLDHYHSTKMHWGFAGMVAEVVVPPDPSIQMEGYSLLRPLWDRPDGYGRAPFWWSNRDLQVLTAERLDAIDEATTRYLERKYG